MNKILVAKLLWAVTSFVDLPQVTSMDFKEMQQTLPNLMNSLRNIWMLSKHYNTDEQICGQFLFYIFTAPKKWLTNTMKMKKTKNFELKMIVLNDAIFCSFTVRRKCNFKYYFHFQDYLTRSLTSCWVE